MSATASDRCTTRRAAMMATLVLLPMVTFGGVARAQSLTQPSMPADSTLRMLGLRVTASGGPRDTLGVLVASVTRDGPADNAGISTGNRIVAVNGRATRLAVDEIGRAAASDSAVNRFVRAVRLGAPGGDVTLRVAGGGAVRTIALPGQGLVGDAVPSVTTPVVTPPVAAVTPNPAPPAAPIAAPVAAQIATPSAAPTPASVATPAAPPALVTAAPTIPVDSGPRVTDSTSVLARWLRAADKIDARTAAAPSAPTPVPTPTPTPTPTSTSTSTSTPVPAPVPPVTSVPTPSVAAVVVDSTPSDRTAPASASGLEMARPSADLLAYLGPQGDSALVVRQASEAYEPLRAGDVVLQVDAQAPDVARLRTALEAHARVTLRLLRRGRLFTVTIGENPSR